MERHASTMPCGEPIGSSNYCYYCYYKWVISVSENIFWTLRQTIDVVHRFDMDSEYNTFRLFPLAAMLKRLVRETWCQITDEGMKSDLNKWYVKNLFILFIIWRQIWQSWALLGIEGTSLQMASLLKLLW